MYNFKTKSLGKYDVVVCGGGIAGIGAALSAARNGASTVIIESYGALGGTATVGLMGGVMDAKSKGGMIKELMMFLHERELIMTHNGPRFDENGKKIPGKMYDIEYAKYFFEKVLKDAGVKILYNSTVCGVDHTDGHINKIMITTYCGNYELEGKIYIDATGNGNLSELCDLEWECGNPPNPASFGVTLSGFDPNFYGTDTEADKAKYGKILEDNNIHTSNEHICLRILPNLREWCFGYNFEYNVFPDDIERFSEAVIHGRQEGFETVDALRKLEGFENVRINKTVEYLGIREGRRVFGQYRLTAEDIIAGKKFEDGICPVESTVDVHKLHENDTHELQRGVKTQPYEIPYRCLVPLGSDNLLLAGRMISGDFYPFASYRMIANMGTVGEAAGYAAAKCAEKGITPAVIDGKEVKAYMKSLGHNL